MPIIDRCRLFFALWPDDAVRARLIEIVRTLQPTISARWVSPDKLHMTLAFLGDVARDRLDDAVLAADSVRASQFVLSFDRMELWRGPGVICVTSSLPPSGLLELAASLANRLREVDFQLDKRPFRAHLTLARKARNLPPGAKLAASVSWPARSFCLVESQADRLGSRYEILQTWPLVESSRAMPNGHSVE